MNTTEKHSLILITDLSIVTVYYFGDKIMKYMLCWSISPENYDAALDAFLDGGAPMPHGLTSLGRWHAPGSTRGWLLCETHDPVALSHHVGQWAGLLNIEVIPVAGDAVAGEAAARVRAS